MSTHLFTSFNGVISDPTNIRQSTPFHVVGFSLFESERRRSNLAIGISQDGLYIKGSDTNQKSSTSCPTRIDISSVRVRRKRSYRFRGLPLFLLPSTVASGDTVVQSANPRSAIFDRKIGHRNLNRHRLTVSQTGAISTMPLSTLPNSSFRRCVSLLLFDLFLFLFTC